MMLLNTSLLRERFTITEKNTNQAPIQALGNRILLPLKSKNGEISERFVIRTHSMHMALMMAARVTQEFYDSGPITNRTIKLSWKDIWYDISSDFERPHTPETWISIYHNGRPIFQDGNYHPFLDIIEQCDIKNRDEYDRAIPMAIDVFKQAGKDVEIEHDVNIASVIGTMDDTTRCGLILRAPDKTSTFNFTLSPDRQKNFTPEPHHGLELASIYLEAIQLSVLAGFVDKKIEQGKIRETSAEALRAKASYKRIGRLNQSITGFENMYSIRYRPEKPDFSEILKEAHG